MQNVHSNFNFLEHIAQAAAEETLPLFRSALSVENKYEIGFDPVTEADRKAELAIRREIAAAYPEHGILGEEHENIGLDAQYVWVIDPIDGTRAYISGIPSWGTLVGLYEKGRAILGLMSQPFIGEVYLGDGQKAFYRRGNQERELKTRPCSDLSQATLLTTSPTLFAQGDIETYKAIESEAKLARYGLDCYGYGLVAGGHSDAVIESGLEPYDVGGIIAIIEGAGGVITTWEGDRPEQGGRIVACGDPRLHEALVKRLSS